MPINGVIRIGLLFFLIHSAVHGRSELDNEFVALRNVGIVAATFFEEHGRLPRDQKEFEKYSNPKGEQIFINRYDNFADVYRFLDSEIEVNKIIEFKPNRFKDQVGKVFCIRRRPLKDKQGRQYYRALVLIDNTLDVEKIKVSDLTDLKIQQLDGDNAQDAFKRSSSDDNPYKPLFFSSESKQTPWLLIAGGVVLLGLLALLIKTWKGKSAR